MGERSAVRAAAPALAVLLLLSLPGAVLGAGFSIFEQGAKAMGMAGAFTAQADDPSAMFHNVGGLGFLQGRQFALGGTYITSTQGDFRGANPFPGTGARGELKSLSEVPPHFYWVQPLGDGLNFGLAVNSPFGLTTEWKNPGEFAGRFLSTKAALRAIDLTPNLGWRVNDNFSVGIGAIIRFSDVELNRRSAAVNPFILQPVEVAKVVLESDFEEGYGFQIGILHKAHPNFTWGLSYRSAISVDYAGTARLSQVSSGDPVFDAIVAIVTPFGQDLKVKTGIDFPDTASLGMAFRLTQRLMAEVDANWTGWSSFQSVKIDFVNNELPDDTIPQDYKDVWNYRLGVRFRQDAAHEWRFGYVYDQTPQPSQSVGPLLPDADRNGYTVGYGHQGSRLGWDLALMYLPFDKRTTLDNRDSFYGTYETTAWLLGGTISW